MNNKKITVSFLIIILLLSLGAYFYFFFLEKKEEVTNTNNEKSYQQEKSSNTSSIPVKENKYYVVYIKQKNGNGSSFVPVKLNPGFKNDADFNVSISFDDYGNIINDNKIIVIDNFVISKENKEMIKKIAGINEYNEALQEIEDRVNETKNNLKKEGHI
ncbi:hypothetical protein PDN49_30450 [Bacillus cereus]|uniref:Uncharacterized protein n=1 Tax=Bacillus thuringiensis TaxID=1428 RepID=A0A9W3VHE0_BACTU|nr:MULTISPECIES: hypothetical protein [Bacillus cereus group]AMR05980.1 hypothetical protein AXW78_28280 [Bacillus thuringiensis]AYF85392.1 hypothetical protein D7J84_30970 [Bacillus thuringiensis]MDA2331292.1 hypothetical protein [Bacillus cereus]MDA2336993.1 hypothetical protein [Bacillus cereus]MDA2358976.1 hypothetical protein [Bacillus cereus]